MLWSRKVTSVTVIADDSALFSLLLTTQDGHGAALDEFTKWCDESYLDLNVNITKEMIADREIQIHEEKVEMVHLYKSLRTP